MNRIVHAAVFIAILAAFAGCSEEMIEELPAPVVPEGYIRAALDLQVEENESIQTRANATEEADYDKSKVWVLLFNATSATDSIPTTLMQAPVKATQSGSDLFVMLRSTTLPVTIYVVAGLTDDLNTYMATATNFTEGTTTFTTVNALLQTAAITSAGVPIGAETYFPMSSEKFYKNGTATLTVINKQPLIRNVAKIDVDASAVNGDFTLEGVTLISGAKRGYVLRQGIIPANNGSTIRYEEKTQVAGNKLTSQIYLYENNGGTSNPTKLLIKGTYKGQPTYYRMDLVKKNEGGTYTPYSIQRNHCYTLVISKLENGGYPNPDEAIAAPPSNTWYEILVDDTSSHEIVSNGQYYLGVSNSEFILYSSNTSTMFGAVDVRTNAPTGTTTSITASPGLTVTPTTFNNFTQIGVNFPTANLGYIDVRVGNLTKRITVERKPGTGSAAGELADFSQGNYVIGSVVNNGRGRIAFQPGLDFDSGHISLVSPQGGGFYIYYKDFSGFNGVGVYLTKANNKGRIKVSVYK